jgi:hypothetical protein
MAQEIQPNGLEQFKVASGVFLGVRSGPETDDLLTNK